MNYDYRCGCVHAAELLDIKDNSLPGVLYGTPDKTEVAQRLIVQAEQQIAEGACPDYQHGVIHMARCYIDARAL